MLPELLTEADRVLLRNVDDNHVTAGERGSIQDWARRRIAQVPHLLVVDAEQVVAGAEAIVARDGRVFVDFDYDAAVDALVHLAVNLA